MLKNIVILCKLQYMINAYKVNDMFGLNFGYRGSRISSIMIQYVQNQKKFKIEFKNG